MVQITAEFCDFCDRGVERRAIGKCFCCEQSICHDHNYGDNILVIEIFNRNLGVRGSSRAYVDVKTDHEQKFRVCRNCTQYCKRTQIDVQPILEQLVDLMDDWLYQVILTRREILADEKDKELED